MARTTPGTTTTRAPRKRVPAKHKEAPAPEATDEQVPPATEPTDGAAPVDLEAGADGAADEHKAEATDPAGTIVAPDVVAVRTPRGSLTLRATQSTLDPEQKAALLAIGIDVVSDPGVLPHLRAFVHMCQVRNLDPWAREAYLIGRGKGDNRKWTLQTAIDGFRKMAGGTGRMVGGAQWLWTGNDDDDRSWHFDPATGIMHRVWWTEWPEGRGYPGAARAIVRHYDVAGNLVQTDAVAHWSMYAPFAPRYEWANGKRTKVRGPDGGDIMELTEMWQKGYAHMLAKCSEALALRKAFPAETSGFVTPEEMSVADAAEQRRQQAAQAEARQRAFEAASAAAGSIGSAPASADPAPGVVQGESTRVAPAGDGGPQEPERGGEPQPVGEAMKEAVGGVPEDVQRRWLLAEITAMAVVMGVSVSRLTNRWVRTNRTNPEQAALPALQALVGSLRPVVSQALRAKGQGGVADDYEAAVSGSVPIDLAVLLEVDAPPPAGAAAAHGYDGGPDGDAPRCLFDGCGGFPDDEVHGG